MGLKTGWRSVHLGMQTTGIAEQLVLNKAWLSITLKEEWK
jgi:hypothetical protein